MGNSIFPAPQMILIGSTGRNKGKTFLAEALIRHYKDRLPVIGLKVTTVARLGDVCPRGDHGCGGCVLSKNYVITEERPGGAKSPDPRCGEQAPAGDGKDTARLLTAGAERVFWLRSLRSALAEGYGAVLEKIPPNALLIAESNSLREVVRPGCFIMIRSGPDEQAKPSAARVADLAQITLESPITEDARQKLFAALTLEPAPDEVQTAGQTRVRFSA
jgi:molybdopterin-guanine dinucleotide biosynthesis protein